MSALRVVLAPVSSSAHRGFEVWLMHNIAVLESVRRSTYLWGDDGAEREAAPDTAAETTAGAAARRRVLWRVLSANNRQLGRSAWAYSTVEDARAHAREIVACAPGLEAVPVQRSTSTEFGWYLCSASVPVMTAPGWYPDECTALAAARAVLAAVPAMTVSEAARAVNDTIGYRGDPRSRPRPLSIGTPGA